MSNRPTEPDTATDRLRTRRRFLRSITAVGVLVGSAGCVYYEENVETHDGGSDPGGSQDDSTGGDGDGASPEGDDRDGGVADDRIRQLERAIHERVNESRRRHDLDALEYNADIAAVAREYSRDMAERDFFSHRSPADEGPADRLSEFFPGYCLSVGENLAKVGTRGDEDPETIAERVVTGWMESPGHRENVLKERFDEHGIGVAIDADDDSVLATQNFCGRSI